MTNIWKTLGITAAGLLAAAGCVSAQTRLKAEIPFAFSAGERVLPAGTYQVLTGSSMSSVIYFRLMNNETGKSILLTPGPASDPPKEWAAAGAPKLAFECGETRCALTRLWRGEGPQYRFRVPMLSPDGRTRIAVIVMRPDAGN